VRSRRLERRRRERRRESKGTERRREQRCPSWRRCSCFERNAPSHPLPPLFALFVLRKLPHSPPTLSLYYGVCDSPLYVCGSYPDVCDASNGEYSHTTEDDSGDFLKIMAIVSACWYLFMSLCCSSTAAYLRHTTSGKELDGYIKKLRTSRMQVSASIECYHTEVSRAGRVRCYD